jgi:hypothetical protein
MPIKIPTERAFDGTFLLDVRQLQNLDKIVDKYAARMTEEYTNAFDRQVDDYYAESVEREKASGGKGRTTRDQAKKFLASYRWTEPSRHLSIRLTDNRRLEVQKIFRG